MENQFIKKTEEELVELIRKEKNHSALEMLNIKRNLSEKPPLTMQDFSFSCPFRLMGVML